MKYSLKAFFMVLCLGFAFQSGFAHINPESQQPPGITDNDKVKVRSDCAPATREIDLAINNVRARLLNGGDTWWDLDDGLYIVPQVDPSLGIPGVSSLFAGAVWLGGFDDDGNLKLAAQTYRGPNNNDFWPGPLSEVGTTGADTCLRWDQFFTVYGESIRKHEKAVKESDATGVPLDCDAIPEDLRRYPGRGNPYFVEFYGFNLPFDVQGLGSFYDHNGDDIYDPCDGDYPAIDVRGCPLEGNYPDQMIYWIYNDAGNTHTNTEGEQIRMEVQVQAFAYATNDEINDMTFYRYKLINRALKAIDSTFFAMWIDPDLGCFTDDYIGCNIEKSLMYVYNEDELDGTTGCDCPGGSNGPVPTYCDEVPILGVDYFRGPRGPVRITEDTIDIQSVVNRDILVEIIDTIEIINDSTWIVTADTLGELGMSSFTYYNNGSVGNWPAGMTDPQRGSPIEFYRLMSGSWRDGTPYSFGGSGYNVPPNGLIDYAFPDDPNNQAGWSMCTATLDFGDRRTIQASGPFRLDPGAINELIIGAVWVADQIYPCPDMGELFAADDLAQSLFNNCFILPDGPDAPDLDFIELDKELVMILSNDTLESNNAFELYAEKGLEIPEDVTDSLYRFEGYKVYQLAGPDVGVAELDDIEKARLIFQVDKNNGVSNIYNWRKVPHPNGSSTNPDIWIPEEQTVDGNGEAANAGILHSLSITTDQFASEDSRLVNHKRYYFTTVAYAYNNYLPFDPFTSTVLGQKKPYLEGRNNVRQYNPLPHPPVYRKVNALYGEEPVVTRLSGQGAGENFLDVADESREIIVTTQNVAGSSFNGEVTYTPGAAPIRSKVVNPLVVQDGSYILEFVDFDGDAESLSLNARWRFYKEDAINDVVLSDRTIASLNEQIITKFGFSVLLGQSDDVGDRADESNGTIGIEVDYQNPSGPQWLYFINDDFNGIPFYNFVKTAEIERDFLLDPSGVFSTMGNGEFIPFLLADYDRNQDAATNPLGFMSSPGWINPSGRLIRNLSDLSELNNVDIVLTSDKEKWSRCVVVETSNVYHQELDLPAEGGVRNFELRAAPSVSRFDGNGDGVPDLEVLQDEPNDFGMGWFPGYAYDVETGQRLNIFFGENSIYNEAIQQAFGFPGNGSDMIWNPASMLINPTGGQITHLEVYNGGSQYVYVTDQPYDGCKALAKDLKFPANSIRMSRILKDVKWTGMPMLLPSDSLLSFDDGIIPNDVVIKIRVDNPYQMTDIEDQYAGYPTYRLKYEGVNSRGIEESEYPEALARINVVPNPYYGYSEYETSQFSNVVKITNLPAECIVTIFSIDGRFIRQYKRNETPLVQSPPRNNPPIEASQIVPDLSWDIKNSKGIPVSSGVYLVHVDAPGIGERVLKWFGINRKFDPTGL